MHSVQSFSTYIATGPFCAGDLNLDADESQRKIIKTYTPTPPRTVNENGPHRWGPLENWW